MEILFAVLILVLIILGLRNRKKRNKEWVKEERYEESGDWIDKRVGERGSYGSLDDEMEANRAFIANQSKTNDLARELQAYLFAQSTGFQQLNDVELQQHLKVCKSEIGALFGYYEQWMKGQEPSFAPAKPSTDPHLQALKKIILDFSFDRFPKLLDLEIAQIQKIDLAASKLAHQILAEIARLRP